MKRILAIALALLMLASLASLAACAGDTSNAGSSDAGTSANTDTTNNSTTPTGRDTSTDTESGEGNDAAVSEVQRKLNAGEEVIVAFCAQGLTDSYILSESEWMKVEFEKLGFTYIASSSDGDVTVMNNQIENFTTMGAAGIIVNPPSTDAVMDTCKRAMEAGTCITFMGVSYPDNYDVSGASTVNWDEVGRVTVDMALTWVSQAFPDAGENEIHVAFANFSMVDFFKEMCEKMIDQLNADPRCVVTYTQDMCIGIDDGFSFAENAMTADRDVRLFMTWQDPVSVGVSNYVMSQPDLDPALFATFTTAQGDDSITLTELSKTNESIYRGTTTYGVADPSVAPAQGIFNVTLAAMLKTEPEPILNFDDIWTVDGIGFNYGL